MCIILMFTQNSFVCIPYLLTYSQQCFMMTLLRHFVFMRNVFCFNHFTWFIMVITMKDNQSLFDENIKTRGLHQCFVDWHILVCALLNSLQGAANKSNPLPCFVIISTTNLNFYKKISVTISHSYLHITSKLCYITTTFV